MFISVEGFKRQLHQLIASSSQEAVYKCGPCLYQISVSFLNILPVFIFIEWFYLEKSAYRQESNLDDQYWQHSVVPISHYWRHSAVPISHYCDSFLSPWTHAGVIFADWPLKFLSGWPRRKTYESVRRPQERGFRQYFKQVVSSRFWIFRALVSTKHLQGSYLICLSISNGCFQICWPPISTKHCEGAGCQCAALSSRRDQIFNT